MKKVSYLVEIQKLIITAIIILIGGLSTLFITVNNLRGIGLLIGGLFLLIILFIINKDLGQSINKKLEDK